MATSIHQSRIRVSPASAIVVSDDQMLLTLNQAAHSLAISKRTLERLISSGTFRTPLKIGRSSRVSRADISAYLERLRCQRGDNIGAS